jgi:hypothetical protein
MEDESKKSTENQPVQPGQEIPIEVVDKLVAPPVPQEVPQEERPKPEDIAKVAANIAGTDDPRDIANLTEEAKNVYATQEFADRVRQGEDPRKVRDELLKKYWPTTPGMNDNGDKCKKGCAGGCKIKDRLTTPEECTDCMVASVTAIINNLHKNISSQSSMKYGAVLYVEKLFEELGDSFKRFTKDVGYDIDALAKKQGHSDDCPEG